MSIRIPICDLFEIEVPIFLAGMGGVAMSDVCAAVSEAGGFGVLGAAGMTPEALRSEMRAVRQRTDKPFGIDLLAALPDEMHAAIPIIETRAQELRPFPDQLMHSMREGVMMFSEEDQMKPERTAMPAGQGVGGISDILLVAAIVENFVRDAKRALDEVRARF